MNVDDKIRKLIKDVAELNRRVLGLAQAAGYHNLLSSTHQDTIAANPQLGDLIYAEGAPVKWKRFPIGPTDGWYLRQVAGLPQWAPVVGTVGEDDIAFKDTFGDASIFWGWDVENTSAAKTVTEAGGVLTIATTAGTISSWASGSINCPMVSIGCAGFPASVWTKITAFTRNDDTAAGLFVSHRRTPSTTLYYLHIVVERDDSLGRDGISVVRYNAAEPGVNLAYVADTTIPIWLRIRIGQDEYRGTQQTFFDYSTDGLAWTNLYNWSTFWTQTSQSLSFGLFSKNWGAANAVSADFDEFRMSRSFGPG